MPWWLHCRKRRSRDATRRVGSDRRPSCVDERRVTVALAFGDPEQVQISSQRRLVDRIAIACRATWKTPALRRVPELYARQHVRVDQLLTDRTGLSKRAVQRAVLHLKKRQLLKVARKSPTAVPEYAVATPWIRS